MTVLSFDKSGVDVVYEGTEFRLERALIEEATGHPYPRGSEERRVGKECRL